MNWNPRSTIVHRRARELSRLSREMCDSLPRAPLRDQLERAMSSVCLNFAEGCGRQSAKERRRYFEIARGSAYEVGAIADFALDWRFIDEEMHGGVLELVDRLAGALYKFR